jgi:cyclic pyranopterin phosphate synthase
VGKIIAICASDKKGCAKKEIPSVLIKEDWGLEGDAHAAPGIRQVSLLAKNSIDKMRKKGLTLESGAFGENIVTEKIDLLSLKIGDRLKIDKNIVLEITQIGKECHTRCAIYYSAGDCIMPREGIFAKVVKGGTIEKGNLIEKIDN